jgi:Family of unknown function (DUF1028)
MADDDRSRFSRWLEREPLNRLEREPLNQMEREPFLAHRSAKRESGRADAEPLWETGTVSILGYDPATDEVGGAVQSRVFSVGNGVLWADADVGVAATQAIVDVGYGPKALAR